MGARFESFSLTLVVNHACNLRCAYCYTGSKFSSPMPFETGAAAIACALRSIATGGRLDLGFFGGEPLLESARIRAWMKHTRQEAQAAEINAGFTLTTNGTISGPEAWEIMLAPDLNLAVSFDGSPALHDRHRRDVHGNGSAQRVESTLRRLLDTAKAFRVVVVVRPDNLEDLPAGLEYLHALGVRAVDLSLDLWTTWTAADGHRLEQTIARLSELWRQWLPEVSINWFDRKAADLAHLPSSELAMRCGFGDGEIAVAPSGRLYPCERIVGEDRPDHPLRLPGSALGGHDFLDHQPDPFARCAPCSGCALAFACDTFCRCSNFVRTGDVNRPDGLLCILNKSTARAVAQIAGGLPAGRPGYPTAQLERKSYA